MYEPSRRKLLSLAALAPFAGVAGAVGEQLGWGPAGNVPAMLARKTSCTVNAISLLRAAEARDPAVAGKIRLSPPLAGSAGVMAVPHVTNCSVVWKFAENREGAKQFLTPKWK